jgi:ribonuclease HI
LHALCLALEIAKAEGARRLVLRGDSDVAVRYVRGPQSTQIARLVILVAQARERIRGFEDVQLLWVPRHRNVEADRLSRQALGLPTVPVKVAKGRRRSR